MYGKSEWKELENRKQMYNKGNTRTYIHIDRKRAREDFQKAKLTLASPSFSINKTNAANTLFKLTAEF